jgi:phosphoribosylanthranilate isomerase
VSDAKWALECGVDAIGLVFAESPRKVAVRDARRIIRAVGPWVATVGVFVNEPLERLLRVVRETGLSAVQLHGDENPAYAKKIKSCRVIKAFRVSKKNDLSGVKGFPADCYLFDAKIPGLFGGTGRTFPWEILKLKDWGVPVVISGGLNPRNVREAAKLLSPYGVEASSGVEKAPGRKDPLLVREFIQNAKNASKK